MLLRVSIVLITFLFMPLCSQTVWEQYLPDKVVALSQIGDRYLSVSTEIGGSESAAISEDLRFWRAIKPYSSFSGAFGCFGGSTIILHKNHKMHVSTDNGNNWQEINWSGKASLWDAPSFSSFASNGTVFVGVGDSGLVLRSTDGLHWERQHTSVAKTVRIGDLACVNNLFLAAAADSSIISSQDGIVWSRFKFSQRPGGAPFSYDVERKVWKYGLDISSDGKTWSKDSLYSRLGAVIGNGDTLFIKSSSSIYKIVDGKDEYRYSLTSNKHTLFYDGSRFVLHDGSTILSSVNGDSWDTLTNGIGKTPIATLKTPKGRCAFTADGITIRSVNDSIWEYIAPNALYMLKAVVIRDSVLYALEDQFARPAILKSVDYGQSWQRVSGISSYLGSAELTSLYADSSAVIATGDYGIIVISPSPEDSFRGIPTRTLPLDSAIHSAPDLFPVVKFGSEYIAPAEYGYGNNGLVRRYVNDTLWKWDSVPELAGIHFYGKFKIGSSLTLLASGKRAVTSDGRNWSVYPSSISSMNRIAELKGILLSRDQVQSGFSYSVDSAKTWKAISTDFNPGLFYSSDEYFYNSLYRSAVDAYLTPISTPLQKISLRSLSVDRSGDTFIFGANENCGITLYDIHGRILIKREISGGVPLSIDLSQFSSMQILYRVEKNSFCGKSIESGILTF